MAGAQSDGDADNTPLNTAPPVPSPLPQGTPALRSAILVLDYETLFTRSRFGQRVMRAIEAEGRALIAENDRIEAELTAEELLLSSQRDDMEPDAFRALADAFDEKVQRIRAEQDAKARAVGQNRAVEERRFRQLVTPILGQIMRDTGAIVVLDRRNTIVWVDAVDVTERVMIEVNRVIGAGAAPEADTPEDREADPSEMDATPEAE